MRFVGRDRELKKLNELYQEEEFQFVVIYGRRRVGKTMLINEFLKRKDPHIIWQLKVHPKKICQVFQKCY